MARKFTLAEKPCTLGKKFTTNGDGEGEERTSVAKFSLEGLMLNARELDKLLGAGSHARLFVEGKGDDIKPAFGDDINELKLAHRYVDSTITLSLDDESVTLVDCKIMGIALQPQIGGMTWLACDVEASADQVGVEDIGQHCGMKTAAQIAFGQKPNLDKRQKSLPLGEGKDDQDEDDAGDDKPRNGTQPAAH